MDKETKGTKIKLISPRDLKKKKEAVNYIQCPEKKSNITDEKTILSSKKEEKKKTLSGVPVLVMQCIRSLEFTLNINSHYRKPLKEWNTEQLSTLLTKEGLNLISIYLKNNEITVDQIINKKEIKGIGVSVYDIEKLYHLIDLLHQLPTFYQSIQNQSIYSNYDYMIALNIINMFEKGNDCIIDIEKNPFIVLLILKLYFLSYKDPFFNQTLLDDIKNLMNKNGSKDIDKQIKNEFKNIFKKSLSDDNIAILIKLMNLINNKDLYNDDKEKELFSCYIFDILSPLYPLNDYIKRCLNIFEIISNNDNLCLFDPEEEYIGETITYKFNDIRCPLSTVSDPVNLPSVTIPGQLFITTYRIIFIPSIKLDNQRKELFDKLGQCPLSNIVFKTYGQLETKEIVYYYRIYTSTYLILTFFTKTNIVNTLDNYIDTLKDQKSNTINLMKLNDEKIKSTINNSTNEILYETNSTFNELKFEIIENNQLPHQAIIYNEFNYKEESENRKLFVCYSYLQSSSKMLRCSCLKKGIERTYLTLLIENIPKNVYLFNVSINGINDIEETFKKIFNLFTSMKEISLIDLQSCECEILMLLNNFNSICKNIIKHLTEKDKIVILLPNNLKEKNIAIFSSYVKLLCDSNYRTIKGFIKLIKEEFTNFDYDFNQNKSFFSFFLIVIECLLDYYPKVFEFNQKFLRLIHHHSTTNIYKDFCITNSSILSDYLMNKIIYFKNPFYEQSEELIHIKTFKNNSSMFRESRSFSYEAITKLLQIITGKELELNNLSISIFPIFPDNQVITNITQLDLSNNNFNILPIQICQMINLKKLNLSHNEICNITPIITKLSNLSSLNLSYNKLNNVENQLININIKELNLSSTEIKREIKMPKTLEKLILESTNIIPDLSERSITYLDLSKNISFDLNNCQHLFPTTIELLKLSQCSLNYLPKGICTLINLKDLDISNNEIEILPPSFFSLTQLTSFNISNTNINDSSIFFKKLNKRIIKNEITEEQKKKKKKDNKEDKIKYIQEIKTFITGVDNSKSELFEAILKKLCKEKQGNEKNLIVNNNNILIEITNEQIEENPLSLIQPNIYIICNKEGGNLYLKFYKLLDLFKKIGQNNYIICIEITNNEKKSNKMNIIEKYKDLHINFLSIEDINKDINLIIKTLKNQISECKLTISSTCEELIKELSLIDTTLGIIKMKDLFNLFDLMNISEDEYYNYLILLEKTEHIIPLIYNKQKDDNLFELNSCTIINKQNNTTITLFDYAFVTLSIPHLIESTLSTLKSDTNISTADFLLKPELTELTIRQQEFVLEFLEHYNFIYIIKEDNENENLSLKFNSLYSKNIMIEKKRSSLSIKVNNGSESLSQQLNQSPNINKKKSLIIKTSGDSLKSLNNEKSPLHTPRTTKNNSGPIHFNKKKLPRVLILNILGLKNYDFVKPLLQKNEIQVSRKFIFNYLTPQFVYYLISIFGMKEQLFTTWKTGFVARYNRYEIYCEWDSVQMVILFSIRIKIETINSFLNSNIIWKEIEDNIDEFVIQKSLYIFVVE